MSYESVMGAINRNSEGKPQMPSDEQRGVIQSKAPLILVKAGAGSGKTRTMVNRIAWMIENGAVKPSEVLGLTFTNKAAGELAERVAQALRLGYRGGGGSGDDPQAAIERPTITTYNSFGAEILATYGLRAGMNPGARLITEGERAQLMGELVDELSSEDVAVLGGARSTAIQRALAISAALADNQVSFEEAYAFTETGWKAIRTLVDTAIASAPREDDGKFQRLPVKKLYGTKPEYTAAWGKLKELPEKLAQRPEQWEVYVGLAERYADVKKERSLAEFSDQIAGALALLEADSGLGRELSERYRLVLLDEYQDTSVLQARMLAAACGHTGQQWRSIAAVGDEKQAIYGWRGASANAFDAFADIFGTQMGEKPETHFLPTTYRNDKAVLKAANAVSKPLDIEGDQPLKPRQGAGEGRVIEIRPLRQKDSYRALALYLRDVGERVRGEGREPEMAVLCRTRAHMAMAAEALQEAGVAYELVGGESLLQRPEVITLRAALTAAADPARADALARLCAYLNIGVADLRAFHSYAYTCAAREHPDEPHPPVRLIEALDSLRSDNVPEGISAEAYERLTWLAQRLHAIRAAASLPLGEACHRATRDLGLALAAASRGEDGRRVVTSLESFAELAAHYQAGHEGATLADFLAWLDAVEQHEHGGEGESGADDEPLPADEARVNAGVVQVMTIHGAKGLEWKDAVAIPEMVATGVSTEPAKGLALWPAKADMFPYPLRADRDALPQFDYTKVHLDAPVRVKEGMEDEAGTFPQLPLVEAYGDFSAAEEEYEAKENRRVAYVAFTRPGAELILAGYGMKNAASALMWRGKQRATPAIAARSAFLADMDAAQAAPTPLQEVVKDKWAEEFGAEEAKRLCFPCPEGMKMPELTKLLDEGEEPTALAPIPSFAPEHLAEMPTYPRSLQRSLGASQAQCEEPDQQSEARELSEAERRHALSKLAKLEEEAELLLAERAELAQNPPVHLARPYLTATDVVHLADNHEQFLRNQARPIPSEPYRAARVGTQVHAKIAQSYLLHPTIDLDLEGMNLLPDDARVEAFFAAYEASRWHEYSPLGIEEPISLTLDGHLIRCTIDAILDTSMVEGMRPITIVDWKTGAVPSLKDMPSRQLQLALYRLAYAKAHGIDVDDIGAVFVHLGSDGSVSEVPAQELSEADIVALLRTHLPTPAGQA